MHDPAQQAEKGVRAAAHVPADFHARRLEIGDGGSADRCAVQRRPAAAAGGEQFVDDRIVDHPDFDLAVEHGGDRDAEMRRAAREIRRAVDRIDHPDRRAGLADPPLAFLADEAVVGKGRVQPRGDQAFDLAVDFGQIILRPLEADGERRAVEKAALGDLAGFARQRTSDKHTVEDGRRFDGQTPAPGFKSG